MNESFKGFGDSIGFGQQPAVIVVDFIKGFTNPDCLLGKDFDKEVSHTKNLLFEARKKGIPIIFTTVVYGPHFKDGGYFIQKVPALKALVPGSKWIEVDPRLERIVDSEPLIEKKFASSFFGTTLSSILVAQQVDTVIITGCTTSGCIRATVVDAMQYGYRPIIPIECVGDRSEEAHQANLCDIQTKYGDVVSIQEVYEFMRSL